MHTHLGGDRHPTKLSLFQLAEATGLVEINNRLVRPPPAGQVAPPPAAGAPPAGQVAPPPAAGAPPAAQVAPPPPTDQVMMHLPQHEEKDPPRDSASVAAAFEELALQKKCNILLNKQLQHCERHERHQAAELDNAHQTIRQLHQELKAEKEDKEMFKALINNHRCDEDLSDPDSYKLSPEDVLDFYEAVAVDDALRVSA